MPPDDDDPIRPDADGTAPLWAAGRIALRTLDRAGPGPVVAVDRPYALIGRIAGADLRIDDPAVSARHVYLHLDRRGLFAVDLATRAGTRVGDGGGPCGWLGPGGVIDVAGHRVELVAGRVDGRDLQAPAAGPGDDPLAEAGPAPLARVTLFPAHAPTAPLVLGSELVFFGRSPSCGVHLEARSASRTQCVLVRGRTGAYVVDLVGRGTWLNDRPLRGGSPLADGDALMVGSEQFEVRVEPPWPARAAAAPAAGGLAPLPPAGPTDLDLPPPPPGLPATVELPPLPAGGLAPEAQAAMLAWMMNVLQASHAEILRQQSEFQRSMFQMVRQIHLDNSALLARHMEKVESIHRELAGLREEIRRRFAPADHRAGGHVPPAALPPAAPLRITPHAPPTDPAAATNWLLDRVNKLEQESRSSWRDLLGRLGNPPRRS